MSETLVSRLRQERDEALGLVEDCPDVEIEAVLRGVSELFEEAAAEIERLAEGRSFYTCDAHLPDGVSVYTWKPLAAKCSVCGAPAEHWLDSPHIALRTLIIAQQRKEVMANAFGDAR